MNATTFRALVALCIALPLCGCVTPLMGLTPPVGEETLERRTVQALGIAAGGFDISGIAKDGQRTEYAVGTDDGRDYRCYVTSVIGSLQASDAICTATDGSAPEAASREENADDGACNALLRAAGRC